MRAEGAPALAAKARVMHSPPEARNANRTRNCRIRMTGAPATSRAGTPAGPADPRSADLRAFHSRPPPRAQAPLLPDDGLAARGGRPRTGHLSAGLARRGRNSTDAARSAVGSTRSPPTAASTPSRPGRGRIAFFSNPDGRPPTGRPQAGPQPTSPGWSLIRTRSLQASSTASPVRKRGTRRAKPCNSPSSPRSSFCRPGSGPPCCSPTCWGGLPSRRRVCWAPRPLRSTAHCSGPAQPLRRDILRAVPCVDRSPTPKRACCSNVTCRPGRPPISTASSNCCGRTPPTACRHGGNGIRDARRSAASSTPSGPNLRASARWPSAPTPSPRSRSTRAPFRTPRGEPIPCILSSLPAAQSPL